MQAYVVLLTKCNLSCSHCIRNFTENTKDIISFAEVTNIFDEIYTNNPKTHLILTGGEPTLHPDFFKILSYANNLFDHISICSNGVYNEKILNGLYDFPKITVQISIDGDAQYHDLMRGSGNFEKSLQTIKKLIQNNIPTTVSTTVNKLNINSIIDLGKILTQFNLKKWQIELEQTFSVDESKKLLSISEWNSFVDSLLAQIKIPISIKKLYDFDLFRRMENKYGKSTLEKISNPNCGCCRSKYYIYPDKTVRICTCIDNFFLGNLNEESLNEIIKKFPEMRKKFNIKYNTPCINCEWLYICNGGCPGYSNFVFNEFGFGDIRCPKVRDYYGL